MVLRRVCVLIETVGELVEPGGRLDKLGDR